MRIDPSTPWALALFGVACLLVGCQPDAEQAEQAPAPSVPTEIVATDPAAAPHVVAANDVEAGRYLITVGNCNDCHTHGFMEADGAIAESDWLTGSPIGWRGPWGTTYAANLRLTAQTLTEDGFVTMLHTRKALPPMPWVNVEKMSEADARAVYRYLRALGPKGEAMPRAVPPGVEPETPYIDLAPRHMERLAATPAGAPAQG
ncbi:MAG: hypothetical protein R3362_02145 [Rhodothermales bacterium]|nr:hypothetical protein [Rhodothermales bacterium]